MIRIYLDQNHWIYLAQSRSGRLADRDVAAALALLEEGVAERRLSCPLSFIHVLELKGISDDTRRRALGRLMYDLSKRDTMLPFDALLPLEVDAAVASVFGGEDAPRIDMFSVGLNHVSGGRRRGFGSLPGMTAEEAEDASDRFTLMDEVPFGRTDVQVPHQVPDRTPTEEFAADRDQVRANRVSAKVHIGDAGRKTAYQAALVHYLPYILDSMGRRGIPAARLLDDQENGIKMLLDAMPAAYALKHLELLKQQSDQRKWSKNDLPDLVALSVAVAYCDVVVTERFWTDLAARAGLTERFETSVVSSTADLLELI